MKTTWRIGAVAVLALAACRSEPRAAHDELAPAGEWRYTAYESGRQKIAAQGYLTLHRPEAMRVRAAEERGSGQSFAGTWRIDAMGRTDAGPQDGHGELVGTLAGGRLTINLNPQMRDNNVFIHGALRGGRVEGTWEHAGFAGVTQRGEMTMQRRR